MSQRLTSAASATGSAQTGGRWYLRLGAWVGIGTGPGALMSGGGVAEITSRSTLWLALVLGCLILTGFAVTHGVVGQRRRAATLDLAARAFGPSRGPSAIAMLIAVGTSLWTGFYIGIGSGAVGYLLGVPAAAAAIPIAGLLYVVYRAGFERWNITVALTGAAALTVGILVFFGVPSGDRVAAPGVGTWFSPFAGAGVIVAYAAVFAVRAPDFTWDAARPRDVVWGGLTMFATLMLFVIIGAGIYLRAGSWELADLVNRARVPAAGAALLVLAIIAPSVSGLHSAALALRRLFGWQESLGAALSLTVSAVLGATRFDLQLVGFLSILGAVVPPILSVLLLRGARHTHSDGWTAWAAGAVASVAALIAGVPAHVLVGIIVAGAAMGVAWVTSPSRPHQREGART